MSTTYLTGSQPAAYGGLTTVAITNPIFTGSVGLQQEVTDLLTSGFRTTNMFHDGTNYIAFMVEKRFGKDG